MQKIDSLPISISQERTYVSQTGPFLNWIALQCLKPYHRASEWAIHGLFTPIRPGEFGNEETKVREIFSRVLKVGASAITFPVQVAGMAVGGVLDIVGDTISQKTFTRLSGIEEKRESSKESFMTLNTCMLWGGLPMLFGGMRPSRERIDKVADLVLQKSPDIAVMQEVSFEAGLSLWDKLKNSYAHGFTRIGPNPFLALDTGLFVASKHPIVKEPVYIPLPTEKPLNRGVFCFETPHNCVFLTHLESGYGDVEIAMRKKQLEQIVKEMKKTSGKPALLLGDLNIHRQGGKKDEYTTSGIPKHFHNFYQKSTSKERATCTNELSAWVKGKPLDEPEWEHIDYVLQLKGPSKKSMKVEIIPTYDLENPDRSISDHKAVFAENRV